MVSSFFFYRNPILGVHRAERAGSPQHREAWPPQQRSEGGGSSAEGERQSPALQWGELLEVSSMSHQTHLRQEIFSMLGRMLLLEDCQPNTIQVCWSLAFIWSFNKTV